MEELLEYIETALAYGFSDQKIREELLRVGWSKVKVEEAFFFIKKRRRSPEKEEIIDVHVLHRHVPFSIVFALFLGIIATVIFLAARYRETIEWDVFAKIREAGSPLAEPFTFGSWPALENAEFFKNVKEQFIEEKSDFIESDLSQMILKVYKDGRVVKEAVILSKGREGSWWETPAGLYAVQDKRESHFSSFGRVYLPWSMPFQGNFFIHGWPYHAGGEPVSQGYSGGCIRLSDSDAKEIFELVRVGTPVLVYEKDFESDGFRYEPKVADITAKSYLAADLRSNFVIVEKNREEVFPIASLTKLMTAIVATEYINLEKEVAISREMLVPTSSPRLRIGERISIYNLLYLLLLESSNEAAEALATVLGREQFISLMNEKANAIGMTASHYIDPSGVGEDNISTAEDLFQLAKYLYHNRSFLLHISSGKLEDSAYGPPQYTDLQNFNVFNENSDFLGGKVGKSTPAGETLLAVFKSDLGGEERPIVIVLLGAPDYESEGKSFFAWLKRIY